MGQRYENEQFAAIFCSDLQRSYMTGQIAFGQRNIPIKQDKRLREYNYGDLTQYPMSRVKAEKLQRITEPFPNGESCQQAIQRVMGFLREMPKTYAGKKVLIIGHRATHHALEHWIYGKSLVEILNEPFIWLPEWIYTIE